MVDGVLRAWASFGATGGLGLGVEGPAPSRFLKFGSFFCATEAGAGEEDVPGESNDPDVSEGRLEVGMELSGGTILRWSRITISFSLGAPFVLPEGFRLEALEDLLAFVRESETSSIAK
jgi:hypothetical protein